MEKICERGGSVRIIPSVLKLLVIMKLMVILICSVGLLSSFGASYAQNSKLSLDFSNSKIEDVLKYIEDHTEYSFMYDNKEIDVTQKVNISLKNKPIEIILDDLFGNTVSYKMVSNHIILTPKYARLSATNQRQGAVSGKVTDISGTPLPGVSIVVKGTTSGTISDGDGNFRMNNVPGNAVLVFSFVGMKTQEVAVGDQSVVNVTLKEESVDIGEVVAVGYGTMKRSDLTGSISSVSADDFKMQPMMRSTDALAARLSGVQVTNTSGNPDASVKIRIRGANSINGGNDPLYVCDGVVGASMPAAEEIESIEVLKDASATAIYGSRGANGVILITTKKGSVGKTRISFETFGSFQKPVNLYDKLDAYEYAQEINVLQNNFYTDDQLVEFKKNGGVDWQNEVLQSCWNQNYHLSVDGGSQNVKFHISGQYKKLNGLLKRTSSESYDIRSNFEIDLYKNLKLEWFINGGYTYLRNTGTDQNLGGADAVLFNALTWGPTESIYESDGTYNYADQFGAMGENPYMAMKEIHRWNNNYDVSSNSAITWEVSPGLTVQYRLNLSYGFDNFYKWESSTYTESNATAYGNKYVSKNIFQNVVVNWNKSFGEHNLALTAVGEGSKSSSDGLSASGSYFGNENLEYWGMSTGTTQTAETNWSNQSLLSFVGRANYNYANKYYLTAAVRADGSSKFADGNKWGYFPSGSVAWRASEEDFVKDLNIFSDLKLRTSYGKTGNQGVSPYSTIASLSKVGAYYTYTSKVYGYTSKSINKNLKWEETGQVDLGLDAGFFRNRLNVSMDYYQKDTKKLLLSVTTPYFLGGDDIYQNKGEVKNKGFELTVSATPVQNKDLKWDMQANFSTNRNRIVDLGGETIYGLSSSGNNDAILSDETYILKKGLPLGSLYGYKWLGIWQEDESDEAAKYGNKPGDNKYADIVSDGSIDASDRTNIGTGIPKFIWGFNSTLTYRKWNLNIVLQGVQGCDKLNVMYAIAASQHAKSRTITLKDAWENSWTSSNKSNRFPSVTSETSTNYINSTQWLQDASFIRMKNISLGYTFDKGMVKFGDCYVYVSAQNLFTITKYKGYDPETTSTTTSDVCTGIDSGITPTARTFTFGAQLSF